MVELDGESDPLEIAVKELRAKKIPFTVRRFLPDGRSVCLALPYTILAAAPFGSRCCRPMCVFRTRDQSRVGKPLILGFNEELWNNSPEAAPCLAAVQLRGLEGVRAGGDRPIAPRASACCRLAAGLLWFGVETFWI